MERQGFAQLCSCGLNLVTDGHEPGVGCAQAWIVKLHKDLGAVARRLDVSPPVWPKNSVWPSKANVDAALKAMFEKIEELKNSTSTSSGQDATAGQSQAQPLQDVVLQAPLPPISEIPRVGEPPSEPTPQPEDTPPQGTNTRQARRRFKDSK